MLLLVLTILQVYHFANLMAMVITLALDAQVLDLLQLIDLRTNTALSTMILTIT
jgi:hypothetical protein